MAEDGVMPNIASLDPDWKEEDTALAEAIREQRKRKEEEERKKTWDEIKEATQFSQIP